MLGLHTVCTVRGKIRFKPGSVNSNVSNAHWVSLVCYQHRSDDTAKSHSALSCTENRRERGRQGNSVKSFPFSDRKRGPAPLMKINAEGIGPNRAKWAAQLFACVCVRGGLSYCQCQLDFMPSFLSIWVDSSLYETIILPPTLCVFSAIGGKGEFHFTHVTHSS